MASGPSGTPKLKKKNLPKIESNLYSKTSLNEQVVFAIHFLEQHGVAVTVEEVVSTCFRLFPQSFSLKHYTRWPDSALVIRRLNDARERGFVKGNPLEGFALKYSGVKLAERTAKALGLVKPAPAKKKIKPSKPNVKKVAAHDLKQGTSKKQVLTPVAKKDLPKPAPKSTVAKKVLEQKPAMPKRAVKKVVKVPVVIGKKPVKLQTAKKKITKNTAKPVLVIPKKATEKKPKEMPVMQKVSATPAPVKARKNKVGKAQPVQTTMSLPAKEVSPVQKPVVKKKRAPLPQLTKLQTIQPEVVAPSRAMKPVPMPTPSKEERVKAEKIIRAMERSDAYKLYNKNGHRSKLTEFDFRNMLFATMESTSETLVRNVNLFKGSAAIHNRQDLIKFLDYCEANFADLLKPSARKVSKKK